MLNIIELILKKISCLNSYEMHLSSEFQYIIGVNTCDFRHLPIFNALFY